MNKEPGTKNQEQRTLFSGAYAGKKVFVTGHTGFKGSWFCEWLLLLGAEVTGFSLPGSVTEPSHFDQLGLAARLDDRRGDIRDADAIRQAILDVRPDFVFHLAAQPLVRLSYKTPVETWATNVMGTINVLEALRALQENLRTKNEEQGTMNAAQRPVALMITTDKCYRNREWLHAYREEDPLGGHDPYSSSKAAAEIAIASWRDSFFSSQPLNSSPPQASSVSIASARAGNVIGGGDWAEDRIVPDCIRALVRGDAIPVRNKTATRPWQHVLEPLSGYLTLAAGIAAARNKEPSTNNEEPRTKNQERVPDLCSAFNFGPNLSSNRTVADLVREVVKHWPGGWKDQSDPNAPHEAGKLNLATDKAFHLLGWQPRWDFETAIEKTTTWYREAHEGTDPGELTRRQILEYAGATNRNAGHSGAKRSGRP